MKGIVPVLKPKSMTVTRWIAVGEAIVRGGSAENNIQHYSINSSGFGSFVKSNQQRKGRKQNE